MLRRCVLSNQYKCIIIFIASFLTKLDAWTNKKNEDSETTKHVQYLTSFLIYLLTAHYWTDIFLLFTLLLFVVDIRLLQHGVNTFIYSLWVSKGKSYLILTKKKTMAQPKKNKIRVKSCEDTKTQKSCICKINFTIT